MNASEHNQQLIQVFTDLLNQDIATVDTSSIVNYLKRVQQALDSSGAAKSGPRLLNEVEYHKWLEELRSYHAVSLEGFKATITAG